MIFYGYLKITLNRNNDMNLIFSVCLGGMVACTHRQIYGFVSQYFSVA